tara:strand:+ start:315 stop:521 length:207 start_codon:yes stop_codon:yes gene_type:complete
MNKDLIWAWITYVSTQVVLILIIFKLYLTHHYIFMVFFILLELFLVAIMFFGDDMQQWADKIFAKYRR